MRRSSVLVADDNRSMSFFLTELMRKEGYRVLSAFDGEDALKVIREQEPEVALIDVRMPGMDGLEVIRRAQEQGLRTQFIVITAFDAREVGIEAIKLGAHDYFPKPLDKDEVRIVVRRAVRIRELEEENLRLRGPEKGGRGYANLIGQSPAMRALYDQIEMVLASNVTVLITGESGTGKELVAEAIHYMGPRRDRPFVKINCAAIPDTLLESELFGHERGAFTGAMERKIGKFEKAEGGTILLDEIGDMGALTQAKVLRFTQSRTLERLGGTESLPVDVRIIAATNKDLQEIVREGGFREDLFYRLNVIALHLPPLRERREDIPLLVEHFLAQYSRRFGKPVATVSRDAMDLLLRYGWPGNVRELENVVQRGVVMSRGRYLTPQALPEWMVETATSGDAGLDLEPGVDLATQVDRFAGKVERKLILQALDQCGGRRQKAADLLGISRQTLHNKMIKHGLDGMRFR